MTLLFLYTWVTKTGRNVFETFLKQTCQILEGAKTDSLASFLTPTFTFIRKYWYW